MERNTALEISVQSGLVLAGFMVLAIAVGSLPKSQGTLPQQANTVTMEVSSLAR